MNKSEFNNKHGFWGQVANTTTVGANKASQKHTYSQAALVLSRACLFLPATRDRVGRCSPFRIPFGFLPQKGIASLADSSGRTTAICKAKHEHSISASQMPILRPKRGLLRSSVSPKGKSPARVGNAHPIQRTAKVQTQSPKPFISKTGDDKKLTPTSLPSLPGRVDRVDIRSPLKKKTFKAVIYIEAGYKNTIITITSSKGKVLCWYSAGACHFRGKRKGTGFAAKKACEVVTRKARDLGITQAAIVVKGPGQGRESAVRAVFKSGIKVLVIRDRSGDPHNGCRPPKKRRI